MVWKNADLTRVVNVRPDGKISLPLIGDIQAAGYTAVQLKDSITEQLNTYYKEQPQVSVIVQQINSYAIYILGEVRRPGKYIVKTGTTFLQAISLAGGFTEFASTNRILLKRKLDESNSESSMHVKYRSIISGTQKNILLKSGDTIIIP
jgi:polysaccharide export outer membrane protein